ncbi:TEL2-interacting protein 1 [Spathaspora sp. JA1]|nr:TEL2-interacting protein 1 [Spathaspora sp. JA1]
MLPLRSEIGGDAEKLLAQSLFTKIKPICVELSQESNAAELNNIKVRSILTSLEAALQTHLKEQEEKIIIYRLPNTIADYIFFPISNLLKLPHLDDSITQHILTIIGFLIEYSWSFNTNYDLIDQLFPLLVYLSGGNVEKTTVSEKSLQFKLSSILAIHAISKTLSRSYFQDTKSKRLVYLSNSISIGLDIIACTVPNSQEAIQVLSYTFDTILQLVQCLSSSQQSQILPGVVSSVTAFGSKNSNIPAELTIRILKLLSCLICNSFNDNELRTKLDIHDIKDLKDIEVVWNTNEVTANGKETSEITIAETDHRSLSWVRATSKQLKINLTVFFKSILHSEKNKQRLKSKPELYNEVIDFVTSILNNCFATLFTEFASLSIDIVSSLVYASSYDDEKSINEKISLVSSSVCSFFDQDDSGLKGRAFFEIVHKKLLHLLQNKLTSSLFSVDEEKVSLTIISLKVNFQLIFELSRSQAIDSKILDGLKKLTLKLFRQHMSDRFNLENVKSPSKSSNQDYLNLLNDDRKSNKLDSIELPEYVNVQNISVGVKPGQTKNIDSYIHNLQLISRNWDETSVNSSSHEPSSIGIGTKFIEGKVEGFIEFLSSFKLSKDPISTLEDLEDIFVDSDDTSLESSLSLWIASKYIKNSGFPIETQEFDPDKFLDFSDTEEEGLTINDASEEALYLILSKSEDLISSVSAKDDDELNIYDELTYCCALDAVSVLAGKLPKDQFQTDFLMDNLIFLLKSLTYNNRPKIQSGAQIAIKSILKAYYNNSIKKLIMENSDYLIDSISLQMSVASNLTPVLPGILLIIIKIAGIQLLESNQLTDILTEMFVLLDAYHGYNRLAESFFVVFETLTAQINKQYNSKPKIDSGEDDKNLINTSPYKPWGMTSKEQLVALLSKNSKLLDSLVDYDSNKEYFKRKADVPFSELQQDSDDEDGMEEDDGEEEEPPEVWNSIIPKKVYFILQRIFNYGFTLISQPSFSLKAQIIRTLRLIFPLLCFNYKLVLPLLSSNWPLLVTLISGSKSLATYTNIKVNGYTMEETNLIFQSFEFVTEILTEDVNRQERFFARKFIEAWEFISKHSSLIPKNSSSALGLANPVKQRQLIVSESPISTHPKLKNSLVKFLITGVQAYEPTIPDIVRYNIVTLCLRLKIPDDLNLSRDTFGIIEVIKLHALEK